MTFREYLIKKKACSEAIAWVGDRTAEQAWAECPNGLWMLWLMAPTTTPFRDAGRMGRLQTRQPPGV